MPDILSPDGPAIQTSQGSGGNFCPSADTSANRHNSNHLPSKNLSVPAPSGPREAKFLPAEGADGTSLPRPSARRPGAAALEEAQRAVALQHGEEAAADLPRRMEDHLQRKQKTTERQAEARAISQARVARGEGVEMAADRPLCPPTKSSERRRKKSKKPRRRRNASSSQSIEERRGSNRRRAAKRKAASAEGTVRRRYEQTHARELEQAEKMAFQALETHGIHHHFRSVAKVAFFCAHMVTSDRNGRLAREVLNSVNMPRERMDLVLHAAYTPMGYTPKRDTSRGKRQDQKRSGYDGRTFGTRVVGDRVIDLPGWQDGQRLDSHPGAILVIACAIFYWLSKGKTRRKGYSYSVRGFGRGVFTAACGGCGKDALFGHTDGLPGAMVALKQAGFLEYGQPPAEAVSPYDRGPSGHAYNVYWMPSTVAELHMEALRERLLDSESSPRLAQVAALIAEPANIEGRASGPPVAALPTFDESDIPY